MIVSPKHRFYVPGLAVGEVALPPEEARHAGGVLRLSVGDAVELFDGQGHFAVAQLSDVSKRRVSACVETVTLAPERALTMHLVFAVPKGKRLDWLLEKATELGAASLTPLLCTRSVAGTAELSANKKQRWQGHCLAAAKQCGLNRLPDIHQPVTLAELLAAKADSLVLFGDLAGETIPLGQALGEHRDITILVGPEGGFTDAESLAMREAHARAVRLGTTVLRIETAAVALLAACAAVKG